MNGNLSEYYLSLRARNPRKRHGKAERKKSIRRNHEANIALISNGASTELQETIEKLLACRAGQRCRSVVCLECGRRFINKNRRSIICLAEDTSYDEVKFVTIFVKRVKAGQLHQIDILKEKDKFRRRMHRAELKSTITIGGIEASWIDVRREWLIHLHLLMFDPPPDGLSKLRRACSRDDREGAQAFKSKEVPKLPGLASYLQKVCFYHYPTERTGAKRPFAYPLPRLRAQEYALFLDRYTFEEFSYLMACRRRGSEIVPL